ncbi:MAG: GDP-mannose 4,6-dehydratase [Candidatus Aenigmatarchaeota archaeon]
MELEGLNCLVTGGGGNLGSYVVEKLLPAGANITIMERRSHDHLKLENLKNVLNKISVAWGDIRSTRDCHNMAKGQDIILHIAASGPVPYSIDYPAEVWDNNVNGTFNLLEAAVKAGVKRFLYINSSESYGRAKHVPINEEHGFYPCSPYGASKAAGELLGQSYYESYGLQFISVRMFNMFGVRSVPYSVINKFITLALDDKPITIAGSGEQKRDYVYTEDAAEGVVKALVCDKLVGDSVNIGSGKSFSVLEIANIIKRLVGSESELKFYPGRPGEVPHLQSDITKAKNILGWTPKHTFDEGIKLSIEHIKKNRERYNVKPVSKSL